MHRGLLRRCRRQLCSAAPGAAPKRFADLEDHLSAATRKALSAAGFAEMTPIQAETLPAALEGADVLGRAKTGTGKTLAFILPAVERMRRSSSKSVVKVLVLSPARELAMQIHTEAAKLLHGEKAARGTRALRAECVYGGRKITAETKRMRADPPALLVATPGRLQDHLGNTKGFAAMLAGVETLVLDECDQLLDGGFWPAIREILSFLPPPAKRQTLLFSATMDKTMTRTAAEVLRPGYTIVDTVGKEEATVSTVAHRVVTTPMERQLEALSAELKRVQASGPDHKAIVFFPTANATKYGAELFASAGFPVLEMHSRLSQSRRQRVSKMFRESGRGKHTMLFSSDVSARGLDYPDVTHVLQVGVPSSREQYIHRSGRTGRAGAEGEATLLLSEAEEPFVVHRLLGDLPLVKADAADGVADEKILAEAKDGVDPTTVKKAYLAWLGYYNGLIGKKRLNWSKERLVEEANAWCAVMGWREKKTPGLTKRLLGKMGLKGTPGLRVEEAAASGGGGPRRGGGGGGGRKRSGPPGRSGRRRSY